MGSPPTLAHRQDQQEPTTPTTRAAEAADDLFRPATPGHAITATPPTALTHQQLVRRIEDLEVRGYRVWNQELLENQPTATDVSLQTLRERATAAQLSTDGAERAFDRLNPTFGVPADTRDPLGLKAVRDREAALALGTRVAVASSRENDRDPVVWLGGQDYRAADAIQAARTHPIRMRQPAERAGAER
jgi:hypothetical protein